MRNGLTSHSGGNQADLNERQNPSPDNVTRNHPDKREIDMNRTKPVYLVLILALFATSCAHAPGKWERETVSMQAPGAIVASASKCDNGDDAKCLDVGMWLQPKNAPKAVELLTDVCNRGVAGACSMAANMKKAVDSGQL